MKPAILLLALAAAAITSCTSAYKTGQTPDDVYFSPQRQQLASSDDEYVAVRDKDDDTYYNGNDYYSDRQLRMKVQNRNQWSNLDEWYYNADRYSYSYYDGFSANNPWTANSYWNYNYNPYYSSYFNPFYSPFSYYNSYYSPGFYISGKNNYAYSNTPRTYNLNTYNRQLSNNNYVTRRVNLATAPGAAAARNNTYRYNNNYNNTRSNPGDYLRNSFNNNSSNNTSRPSSNISSGSSSGRSSSSGSSAPVRRF